MVDAFSLGLWAIRNRADIASLIARVGPVLELIKIEDLVPLVQRLLASMPVAPAKLSTEGVQRALNKAGFAVQVDGHMGPQTTTAVERFQAAHQLVVDGWVGPATMVVLEIFL